MDKGDLAGLPRVPRSSPAAGLTDALYRLATQTGWTWEHMLGVMPYANLKIALKKAAAHEAEQIRRERINGAFIGWQYAIWQPLKKGKRHDDFERYCRKMGVASTPGGLTSDVVDAERKRAAELFKRALGASWSEKPVNRRKMV